MVNDRNTGAGMDLVAHKRALTPAQYGDLAEVPPELEWLANIVTSVSLPLLRVRKSIPSHHSTRHAALRG